MLGGILKAVAGPLISGIFGSKQSKPQGVDYQRLRRDAAAAGFNPLTALLAGGGAGYVRDSGPSLASGSFVAEALQRGLDTYFNQGVGPDREAEDINRLGRARARLEATRNSRPVASFGYALTDQEPFRPQVELHGVPLGVANVRPQRRPTDRAPEYIPVRMPDGMPGSLEKSIARRLDVLPFDTISAGDWAEIVGEVGEIETAVMTNEVRDTAIRAPLLPGLQPGYVQRKREYKPPRFAPPLMRNAAPAPGWMDEYFGGAFPK